MILLVMDAIERAFNIDRAFSDSSVKSHGKDAVVNLLCTGVYCVELNNRYVFSSGFFLR